MDKIKLDIAVNNSYNFKDIEKTPIKEDSSIRNSIQHFYHTINEIPYTQFEKLTNKYYLLKHKIKQLIVQN